MSLFTYSSQTRIEIGRVCNTVSKLQPYSELDLARYYLVVVVLSPSKSKKKLLKIILSKGIFYGCEKVKNCNSEFSAWLPFSKSYDANSILTNKRSKMIYAPPANGKITITYC